jgi:hypothetical protein
MNTTVSFELAKFLKEKEFEQKTKSYNEDGKLVTVSLTIRRFNPEKIYYPAPTIAEVVMWLYEKHGIWIEASLNQFSKPKDLHWMYSITFTQNCTYSHSPKSYKSPTEAYEAAIEYTLNNLL